jgi:hypothetical protein
MAPGTAQGAAFQEDGRADSRPVVNGKFFDVENNTSSHPGKLVNSVSHEFTVIARPTKQSPVSM